jgi:ribose transport system ATP-binding protein
MRPSVDVRDELTTHSLGASTSLRARRPLLRLDMPRAPDDGCRVSSPSALDPPLPVLLEAIEVQKSFPGVRALDRVSITVHEGEILGLIGENGAGKSTLMKIVAGIHQPDAGRLLWKGSQISHSSPADAVKLGIEVVPQELSLAPQLSAAENMFVGHYPSSVGRVRWRETLRNAIAIGERLGLHADLRRPAGSLSPSQQRLVMIGRALARDVKLLVLDEPTVSLPEDEVTKLLGVLRQLRADGVSMVYVSHRLEEVLELTDRTTVMKDAQLVGTYPTGDLDKQRMMSLIVGRELSEVYPEHGHALSEKPLLRVSGLSGGRVRDVSFDLFPGEVLGIAGLVGAGRTEVVRMLFGADRREAGEVELDGVPVRIRTPRDAIRHGMALLPEDRRNQGGITALSVAANVTLPSLRRFAWARTVLNQRQERRAVTERIEELRVVTPSVRQPLKYLSGGNQQKALIAKWLMTGARLFIFDEPAVGIDVGAKREIYSLIAGLAEKGAGVIVISSELEEVVGLCQRVLVMREGRMAGELRGPEVSEAAILQLCFVA